MVKILLLVALIFVYANSLHYQKYSPSTPGGTYYGGNGTYSSGSSSNIYNTNQPISNTGGILVNGKPYTYTGPFKLVCYVVGSTTQIYRWDSCYDAYNCDRIIRDYQNCKGKVSKFPL